MRIDQFLSESRIIKRRALAKEACDRKLVFINGQPAKPGKEVQVGWEVRIEFANRTLVVEILEIPRGNVRKDLAQNLYSIRREEFKKEELW